MKSRRFLTDDIPKIKIIVAFKGDKSGTTKIQLPNEFGRKIFIFAVVISLAEIFLTV